MRLVMRCNLLLAVFVGCYLVLRIEKVGFVDEKSRLNLILNCSIHDSICDFSSPLVSSFSLNWLLHRQMCLVAPLRLLATMTLPPR